MNAVTGIEITINENNCPGDAVRYAEALAEHLEKKFPAANVAVNVARATEGVEPPVGVRTEDGWNVDGRAEESVIDVVEEFLDGFAEW